MKKIQFLIFRFMLAILALSPKLVSAERLMELTILNENGVFVPYQCTGPVVLGIGYGIVAGSKVEVEIGTESVLTFLIQNSWIKDGIVQIDTWDPLENEIMNNVGTAVFTVNSRTPDLLSVELPSQQNEFTIKIRRLNQWKQKRHGSRNAWTSIHITRRERKTTETNPVIESRECGSDQSESRYVIGEPKFLTHGYVISISPNPECIQIQGDQPVIFTLSQWVHDTETGKDVALPIDSKIQLRSALGTIEALESDESGTRFKYVPTTMLQNQSYDAIRVGLNYGDGPNDIAIVTIGPMKWNPKQ